MSKLNNILQLMPNRGVVLDSWLKEQGISNSLKQRYIKSGWLQSIGRGASYRVGDAPSWQGAVSALQQEGMKFHIGGKTALELQGVSHFVSSQIRHLHLYGVSKGHLPNWFTGYDWQVEVYYLLTKILPSDLDIESFLQDNGTILLMSIPERAILELLYLVPASQSIEEAYYIIENMNSLRPNILQSLLEACTSIKVKRLFFYLSDRAGHPWVHELNKDMIDLGTGNREIVSGGTLDPTYHITIPKNWKEEDAKPIF